MRTLPAPAPSLRRPQPDGATDVITRFSSTTFSRADRAGRPGLRVRCRWPLRAAGGPNQIQLGFEAGVPMNAPRPLSIMFAIADRAGRVLNAGKRIVSDPAETDEDG